MVDSISIDATPLKDLDGNIRELADKLGDLRPLFELFSSDFYKDEKRIFSLSGPGQYEDLDPNYEDAKQKKYGFIFPILFASGRLASSLLSRRGKGSVNIVKKMEFVIGTSVMSRGKKPAPYPKFLHEGTKFMPARPIYFFGEDNMSLNKRWNRTTKAYLDKIVKEMING